jgi:hypothetical protein
MAVIERQALYSSWDNICTSYNVKQVRLPDSQNSDHLIINWNGVITSIDWAIWHQKFNTKQSMREWGSLISKAFSVYVGNCYKNATWNSSQQLRKERGYRVKTKTSKYQTTVDSINN